MFKINQGDKVRDIITDFTGIVTGRSDFITGCRQYSVTPKKHNVDPKWFDEDRLEVIKKSEITIKPENNGGPMFSPSKG